ncbi:MAG: response regulator [Candidatus Colwellbacteria bacterium]|nr:response regulator [Candidatus Colwellbacteria bacterium]
MVETATAPAAQVQMQNQTGKKVLLIEDDLFLSNILTTRMQRMGVNVLRAMDGEEAIKLGLSSKPNLILLDIIIPKISGFEVLEELKGDPTVSKAPVIVISNLGQESDIERAKKLGVQEYFIKAQVSIDDIMESVRKHLG